MFCRSASFSTNRYQIQFCAESSNPASFRLIPHVPGCIKSFSSSHLARVVQAGVVPMDTAAVASELQRTWNRPDAAEWAEVYTKVFPAYQLLIESYSKAQDVVKNNEQLDSQR